MENRDGFVRYWDDVSAAPFLYNERRQILISYDDVESVRLKSRYVMDRGLGGIMFWELSGDPQHELIDAIWQSLRPAGKPFTTPAE